MPIEEKVLDEATTLYIQQHARILYDCIHLVMTSKNKKISTIKDVIKSNLGIIEDTFLER